MAISAIRKFLVPEMIFGTGSRKLVGQYSRNLGITKVLIVTDSGIIRAGWLNDSLTHAIEAFVSKGRSSFTDLHALEAIKLIAKYLPMRYSDPKNSEALEKMMLVSTEAGMAFSNAILGAVHSLSHSVGGFLDLTHGECNAMLIDSVIGFNYDSEPDRFNVIAEAIGLNFKNKTYKERKKALLDKITEFKKGLGIVGKLNTVGVKSSDIPLLAKKAYTDPCHITNPKTVSIRDIQVIYEESM